MIRHEDRSNRTRMLGSQEPVRLPASIMPVLVRLNDSDSLRSCSNRRHQLLLRQELLTMGSKCTSTRKARNTAQLRCRRIRCNTRLRSHQRHRDNNSNSSTRSSEATSCTACRSNRRHQRRRPTSKSSNIDHGRARRLRHSQLNLAFHKHHNITLHNRRVQLAHHHPICQHYSYQANINR